MRRKIGCSGAERGAGGRGAGTERRAGVTAIGWRVERLFRRSDSVHMLCSECTKNASPGATRKGMPRRGSDKRRKEKKGRKGKGERNEKKREGRGLTHSLTALTFSPGF